MKLFAASSNSPRDQTQSRLLRLAGSFVLLFAIILSLSQAVRLQSWLGPYRWQHWLGVLVWLAGFSLLHRQTERLVPDRDPYLLPIVAFLSGWGLLTIWRLDANFGFRQTLWLVVCVLLVFFGLKRPELLQLLRRYKYLWLTGGLLLTGLTFFLGTYPGGIGPRLWLGCCGIYLQPSEPLKLLLIVYLSAYLADRLPISFSLMQLLMPTLVLSGAALVILVAQRDLGTASIFLAIYAIIIYIASGRRRLLAFSLLGILGSGLLGYQLFDVIQIRVNAWLNPWLDPTGRSYQIVQSLLAFAAGGTFGRGPGMGAPYLVPVSQSDFIFAAIAEEMGMLGSFGLILLLGLLILRGFETALYAPNNYLRYLAAGLTTYLGGQSILIMAGNLRLLPLTGVTLPFVSYGGSSLATSFISLLLLLLISSQAEEEPAALHHTHQPYVVVGTLLLGGLMAIGTLQVWWGYVRSGDLLARTDNPRRSIADQYVRRGSLLDRRNEPIVNTQGQPGSYERMTQYPALSAVTGYTHPFYGQAGLESTLDSYLRGMQGNPTSLIWSHHLLYGQPPPGLDVRLSIDLNVQRKADEVFQQEKGALVLLNAQTGEILAMVSNPSYNANTLDADWQTLMSNPDSPLINRVTQGQYPLGTAFGPFLLATTLAKNQLPPLPETFNTSFQGQQWECTISTPKPLNWGDAITQGCPGALVELGTQLSETQILDIYRKVGFLEAPTLPLPQAAPAALGSLTDPRLAVLGQDKISVSPLQVALAAAEITTSGVRPAPRLTLAVNTPSQGWVILPNDTTKIGLVANGIPATIRLLTTAVPPSWQTVGSAWVQNGQRVTWYLAGTLPDWQGAPLALVVLLESDQPERAQSIGQAVLKAAQTP